MIEKAVEGDPDNIAYRDSLGWALYRLERYREAGPSDTDDVEHVVVLIDSFPARELEL